MKFITALAGLLLGLAIVELGIRLANHFFPYYYTYDRDRGWALRPNAQGWWTREGRSYVKINSDGLRDVEHSKAKPPNTFRIAVLGDSYAQAIQVPLDQTWWRIAGERLNQCPALHGEHVEVINFGVDGYGTAQELITLKRHALSYSPDAVVLAVFLGNDVRNNSLKLESNRCRPFYELADGKLVPAGPFLGSRSYRLWCLARFGYRDLALLEMLETAAKIILHPPQTPTPDAPHEPAINEEIYRPPTNATWREAWRITEALITEIANVARSNGAKFLAVTLDTGIQVWPDPEVSRRFIRNQHIEDIFYPDKRIAALGKRAGFEVLTLAPQLQKFARQHHVYLHGFPNTPTGFGHWNKIGHRIAGELIAAKLCNMLARSADSTQSASP